MPPILVRHASAGDRAVWEGDDLHRPLDERGRGQAEELVSRLAPFRVDAIHSSPAVRCIETVEPLASALGLPVVVRDELAEERQWEDGGPLLQELAGQQVVVCGHGGLEHAALREPRKWRKGAAFVLDEELRIVAEV